MIVSLAAGDLRVDAFHRGIYWDEFADQHEPLASWHTALRTGLLRIDLALDGESIIGGICYERYPRSGCGLLTYIVVAPAARGQGLGKTLQTRAVETLYAEGAPLVLGELDDPRVSSARQEPRIPGLEPAADAWERVHRNQRWGARVADVRYVQPALGEGLERDRQLLLIVLAGKAALPSTIDGATLRAFMTEFYEMTEGGPPDPEISIPHVVRLIEL